MYKKSIYQIRDSVDIYYINKEEGFILIQFYKINTRQRISIKAHSSILKVLCAFDGKHSLEEICNLLQLNIDDFRILFNFLLKNNIIREVRQEKSFESLRFDRQINFFDDLTNDLNGIQCQKILESKKIVIFGVGSIGSSIAILLARMGFRHLTLIDYKVLTKSNIVKHLYANTHNIGQLKTEALKSYIHKIDKTIQIKTINKEILPQTDLYELIDSDASMVINTMDEPYIGHLSKKIGNFLWDINIPMFVAGGFDAHSMSTGELIVKNLTGTIDQYQAIFKEKLKDWKPTYSLNMHYKNINLGGAGSLPSCSLFSASSACMRIIYYFLNVPFNISQRGEYCLNEGKIHWINLNIV